MALTFVSTPIVVGRLGPEQYGLFAVILGYLAAAFSTGVGKLSAKYIPEYRASGSPEKLSDAISATVLIAFGLGVLQAALLGATAEIISRDVLLLEGQNAASVVLGLRIAAVTGLVMINSQVFQFAAQGLHRFDIYAGLTVVGSGLSSLGNIVLVLNGIGLIGLLIWNAVVATTVGIAFFATCRPLLREWHLNFRLEWQVVRPAVVYAVSIVIYQALTSILYAFERSIVVRRFGAESAAFYVIPLMLATYLHAFLASFAQVLFPVVNELLEDRERLLRVYLRSTKIVFLVTSLLLASYIACGQSFLRLWLGSEFAERSTTLLYILAFTYAINAFSIVSWLLVEAFKAPTINALSSAVWAFTAMPMMVFAGTAGGLEAIATARLVGIALTFPLIFFVENRFLGSVRVRFWAGLVTRTILAGLSCVLVQFLILKYLAAGWIGLGIAGVLGSASYVATLLLTRCVTVGELGELAGGIFPSKRSLGNAAFSDRRAAS